MPEIVVVGSVNMDTVVQVDALPQPGETILANGHFTNPGGKGANQAVAAARLGRQVAFIGAVGADDVGAALREALAVADVEIGGLATADATPSGIALITVGPKGTNTIVVSPGANAMVGAGPVVESIRTRQEASCLLVQLEVPIEAVAAAIDAFPGTVILNPAPARVVPSEVLTAVDVLVPNETELAKIAGGEPPDGPEEAIERAVRIDGPKAVVVTLGRLGAVVVEESGAQHLPAPEVDAVDTTAAGDAFCGALADALVGGSSLPEAARWGVAAGSFAVTRRGAQQSLPKRAEVEALLS